MIRVCYNLPGYFKNEIFDLNNKKINRDNYAFSHFLLKSNAKKNNIDISTSDLNSIEDSEFIISHDVCKNKLLPVNTEKKKWLILFESEVISPLNWIE
ncbi:hypothetical protein G6Z92_12680, partial [Vibrio aestuarianus subsp. cardii]|uniref:hypothetical protein n=1 Tax=Vibrio aestuarianus TaxID=28171 RepID=UPI003BB21140|nr:hypothetical protein [Vibrio aestuarianus subsp. cardii]